MCKETFFKRITYLIHFKYQSQSFKIEKECYSDLIIRALIIKSFRIRILKKSRTVNLQIENLLLA